jgi:hypothetical protein
LFSLAIQFGNGPRRTAQALGLIGITKTNRPKSAGTKI